MQGNLELSWWHICFYNYLLTLLKWYLLVFTLRSVLWMVKMIENTLVMERVKICLHYGTWLWIWVWKKITPAWNHSLETSFLTCTLSFEVTRWKWFKGGDCFVNPVGTTSREWWFEKHVPRKLASKHVEWAMKHCLPGSGPKMGGCCAKFHLETTYNGCFFKTASLRNETLNTYIELWNTPPTPHGSHL